MVARTRSVPLEVVETSAEEESKLDRRIRLLIPAVLVVVVLILTVLVYGLVAGVINPAAPRTAEEFALNRAETMIASSPGNAQYWADYIEILSSRRRYGDATGAVADARKAIGADETILLINNAELILLMEQGKFDEVFAKSDAFLKQDDDFVKKRADEYATKGVTADPHGDATRKGVTIETLNLRASAAVRLEKYDDAIKALDYALTLSPTAADVSIFRGNVYALKGDAASLQKAKEDYEYALQFLPNDENALAGLEDVEKRLGGVSGSAEDTASSSN